MMGLLSTLFSGTACSLSAPQRRIISATQGRAASPVGAIIGAKAQPVLCPRRSVAYFRNIGPRSVASGRHYRRKGTACSLSAPQRRIFPQHRAAQRRQWAPLSAQRHSLLFVRAAASYISATQGRAASPEGAIISAKAQPVLCPRRSGVYFPQRGGRAVPAVILRCVDHRNNALFRSKTSSRRARYIRRSLMFAARSMRASAEKIRLEIAPAPKAITSQSSSMLSML